MKLSVCVITCNQEAWIGQAIASAIGQDTAFEIEIVVGEDASDDRTLTILRDFERSACGKIRVNSRERRLGLVANFVRTVEECRGDYIALLDGDDYWTDPGKLQLQCGLLDAHPECSLCFHQAVAVDASGDTLEWSFVDTAVPEPLLPAHLLQKNWIPSSSVVWRREALPSFPPWFRDSPFEDWPLFMLLATRGEIRYIPRTMSAYRQHPTGFWSSLSQLERCRRMSSFILFLGRRFDQLPAAEVRAWAAQWKLREAVTAAAMRRRTNAVRAFLVSAWLLRFRDRGSSGLREAWRTIYRRSAAEGRDSPL